MERIKKIFDMSYLDDNLELKVRKCFLLALVSGVGGIFSTIVLHSIVFFLLFILLSLILLSIIAYVIHLCKNDKLKKLNAECIEFVKKDIKQRIFRSYFIFENNDIFYKLYFSWHRYRINDKVTFYMQDRDLINENNNSFVILYSYLTVVEKMNKIKK